MFVLKKLACNSLSYRKRFVLFCLEIVHQLLLVADT